MIARHSGTDTRVLADAAAVAEAAAAFIAVEARSAIGARGRFVLAVSGGRTPWDMLRRLAREDLPWERVHVFQVDERVAPAGDAVRNLTHLHECLDARVPPARLHAMPVEAPDLVEAAQRYAHELAAIAGVPPILDLAHLGLGNDGHTASLVPHDPVLAIEDRDVALSGPYEGHLRMTMTRPLLDRARRLLFVVTGAEKAPMLARLRAHDATIPAGCLHFARAMILCDALAAGEAAPGDMR